VLPEGGEALAAELVVIAAGIRPTSTWPARRSSSARLFPDLDGAAASATVRVRLAEANGRDARGE
jgi:hypothetical protein